jgi:hypothetical protein
MENITRWLKSRTILANLGFGSGGLLAIVLMLLQSDELMAYIRLTMPPEQADKLMIVIPLAVLVLSNLANGYLRANRKPLEHESEKQDDTTPDDANG